MQAKQVFSTYSGKEDGNLGQFKHCPFCGTQLALKEKGGKQRQRAPTVTLCSSGIPFLGPWS